MLWVRYIYGNNRNQCYIEKGECNEYTSQTVTDMRILTVAFYDDNYGDMLIRTCFIQLTKVALKNLGINDYTLDIMPLKQPNDEQTAAADLIIFAGGGLFGLSYLDFAVYIERILDVADAKNIPVVFSSLGINNMDATEENENRLTEILRRPCIKAMSVRENLQVFEHYAEGHTYEIRPVSDPVVWAAQIYAADIESIIEKKKYREKRIVGLNVVRGGLFRDNGVNWTLTKEEEYLYALSQMLEEKGIDHRFFTNGSTWDINTLRHFQKKYKIPREKLIISDTSREVIQSVADFDAVVAIRMHASIIAYALSVPSINFVWNPKIPEFYDKIGYPDRAVQADVWTAQTAMEMTQTLLDEQDYHPDQELLMSLYAFLFDTYGSILAPDKAAQMYGYESVCEQLGAMTVPEEEDAVDMRTKLRRAESRYYKLFTSDDRKKGEIKKLIKKSDELKKQLDDVKKKLDAEKKARSSAEKTRDAAQGELKRLHDKRSFRAYEKVFDKKK